MQILKGDGSQEPYRCRVFLGADGVPVSFQVRLYCKAVNICIHKAVYTCIHHSSRQMECDNRFVPVIYGPHGARKEKVSRLCAYDYAPCFHRT